MCQKLRLLRNAPAYADEWLNQGQAPVFLHHTSRPKRFSHIRNDKITMRPMSNPHIHGSRADLSRMPQVSSSNGAFLMISFVLCMLLREYNTWIGFLVTRAFGWRLSIPFILSASRRISHSTLCPAYHSKQPYIQSAESIWRGDSTLISQKACSVSTDVPNRQSVVLLTDWSHSNHDPLCAPIRLFRLQAWIFHQLGNW